MAKRNLRLYEILPAYIRERDDNGHTRRYLEAADQLLDRLHATIEQYHADNFPDQPLDPDALAAQEWLLPYFARLVDARLVSPQVAGRREEVAQAIGWRQRKGTLAVVDQVSEAVGQWEVVAVEGWKKLAMTPRLAEPLLPEAYFGVDVELDRAIPQQMTRHPGLPVSTPDFRCGSKAVPDPENHPSSQVSRVHGESIRWRQYYRHGVPCHHQRIDLDGSFHGAAFDDSSRRTPDLRTPDWRVGHHHPRSVLLHVVQPEGFFATTRPVVRWRQQWLNNDTLPGNAFLEHVTLYSWLDHTLVFSSRGSATVQVQGVIKLGQVAATGVGDADAASWHFQQLVLRNKVEADSGRVSFESCAFSNLAVHSIDAIEPVVSGTNSLLKNLQTASGLSRLEYCTVLDNCVVEVLQASDCIFACKVRSDHPGDSLVENYCIRYSKVLSDQEPQDLDTHFANTREQHYFFSDQFGEPGCGVLHPASSESITRGAEDGTEMGAYHQRQYSLRMTAVVDKLRDYLPLGYQAVVIPDVYLGQLNV